MTIKEHKGYGEVKKDAHSESTYEEALPVWLWIITNFPVCEKWNMVCFRGEEIGLIGKVHIHLPST